MYVLRKPLIRRDKGDTNSLYLYKSCLSPEHLVCVCVCMCVVFPFIVDVRLVDVSAGVTQEGHTGFLIHLPSAVLALIFIARRIQPFLSLVDREVEFRVLTGQLFSTCWAFLGKIPVRVTAPRFELTSQRQKVSRLPTEPPGRPSIVNKT